MTRHTLACKSARTDASTSWCRMSRVATLRTVCLRRQILGRMTSPVFSVWQDQRTDFGLSGCASFPGGNCGVFTSVSGSAPNRIFNIEWRTVLFADNNATQNHEVRLYENDPNLKFEVIIGNLTNTATENWVSGVQGNSAAGFFTQDFCASAPPTNVSRNYEIPPCGLRLRLRRV